MRRHGARSLTLLVAALAIPGVSPAAVSPTGGDEDPPRAVVDATLTAVYVPGALAGHDPTASRPRRGRTSRRARGPATSEEVLRRLFEATFRSGGRFPGVSSALFCGAMPRDAGA